MKALLLPSEVSPDVLPDSLVEFYRENGFVRVPGLLTTEEALRYRQAALEASDKFPKLSNYSIFDQNVNIWRVDETMRSLTLSPRIHGWAKQLSGLNLRLWHDQILIKRPHNNAPTEFHQDQPYWPHDVAFNSITCWIALGDVPVERGCMTFLPGFQNRNDLPAQNLGDPRSLMELCPEMNWSARVTLPLRAGDVTFHMGRTPHMANANDTDVDRVAHAVIMMDANTIFNGTGHVVTDPLELTPGQPMDSEMFPLL